MKIPVGFLILISMLVTAPVSVADVYWDNGGGDNSWFTANNWSGNSLPASTDNILFENSSHRLVNLESGSDTVNDLYLGGTANTYTLNLGTTGFAELTVTGYLWLGYNISGANATFSIDNDSVVQADAIILGASGSTGTLDIDYGGAQASTFMTLGSSTSGSGYLDMSGSDTSLSVGTNLNVGFYGTGGANIDGGIVTVGTDLRVGYYSGAYGELALSNNASVTVADDLTVYQGEGLITQESGSDLTITEQAFIGESGSGVGSWSLNNSTASVGDDLFVGYDGDGTLTLANGASLDVTDYLVVARNSGSTGEAAIDGSGSSLTAAYAIIGGNSSGDGGTGALVVNDGTVTIANSTTVRGPGTITLNGGTYETGSLSTVASGGSLVHNAGTLHLNGGNWDIEGTADWVIESADGSGTATVEYTGSTVDHGNHYLTIGNTHAGELVLNTGSNLILSKDLVLGAAGTGTMTFNGDAAIAAGGDVVLGETSTGTGIWTGANGTIGGSLYIGYDGAGQVSMSAGDSLEVDEVLYIAGSSTGTGTLELSDAQLSAYVLVPGTSGSATLTASNSTLAFTSVLTRSDSTTTVTLTDSTTTLSSYFVVGSGSYATGTSILNVSGGSIDVGTYAKVGSNTSAEAYLSNGAQVTVATDLFVADLLESDGSETALLSLTSASFSNPTFLDIRGDASVEDFGTWTTDEFSNVRIGDGDTGTITTTGWILVSDTTGAGGTFTMDDDDDAQAASFGGQLLVGWNSGETGKITLGGTATVFTTNDIVRLGENGTATMTLDNGATWYANGDYLDLADETGTATLTLKNDSQFISDGPINVGDTTGTATLNLLSGSAAEASYIVLGDDASTGTLNVNASTLSLPGSLYVGDGSSTQNGSGTVNFTNGSVFNGERALYAGYYGTGSVTFDQSSWISTTSDSARIYAGYFSSGDGTVVIQNGSTLTIESIYVGYDGTGTLTVDGSGTVLTQLDDSTQLILGSSSGSTGTMTVQNGATHLFEETSSTGLRIGDEGVGHYTVTGAGSSSDFASSVYVGYSSTAAGSTLYVQDGASFTGTALTLRNNTSALVEGSGSSMSLSGNLDLDETGANSFTLQDGASLSIGGTLFVGSNDTFTVDQASLTLEAAISGNIAITDPISGGSALTVGGDGSDRTFSGIIADHTSGAGSVTKTGGNTITFSGANTYSGGTTISAGTLQLGNGGTTGSIAFTSVVNDGTLAFNRSDDLTVASIISGTGTLTQAGAGTLTLTGAHTFTGTTSVNAGTLLINGSTSTGIVTVASGATLGGNGTVGGAATISGIHSPGNSPGIQSFGSGLSYMDGSSVTWEQASNSLGLRGTDFDGINVSGNLDFAGTTAFGLVFDFAGSTVNWADGYWDTSRTGTDGWLVYDVTGTTSNFGNLSITAANWLDGSGGFFNDMRNGNTFSLYQDGNDIYLNYSVIPEPSAALLGGIGALLLLRRRRN